MKKERVAVFLSFCFFVFLGVPGLLFADSAEVLPKGVFNISAKTAYYLPIDTRFDPDGDEEDIAADYNAVLDSDIFPDLACFEDPVCSGPLALPAGETANIGESDVSFEITATELSFDIQYGVTEKFTVGLHVPYAYYKREVDAELVTTNATIGKNPFYDPTNPLFGPPLIPIVSGGTPLTTEDVQDLLGNGLDVDGDGVADIQGFGYERFETWSDNGLGDIVLGGRYQYLKTENWRLAFTGGVRFPTGKVDDPDHLADMGFGTGAWALLFQFQNDYIGIENLVLNASFKYDLVLPDTEKERVSSDVNNPISRNVEKVDRDLGDYFKVDTSATYEVVEGFDASLAYQYWYRLKDQIDGDQGFAYESLEDETDKTAHIFLAGLTYSTIPLFKEKKFPLPLNASITYENVFAGSNNFLKQQDFIFSLSVFF